MLQEGILHRKSSVNGEPMLLPVIPSAMRRKIITDQHWSVEAGHPGVKSTTLKISAKYWWPGIRDDVSKFIRDCPDCQRRKPSRNRKQPYRPLVFELMQPGHQPFSMIGFDAIVMNQSPTSSGFNYIFVARDYMTRYVVIRATKDYSAETVAHFLLNDVFMKHGVCKVLITDRHPSHMSKYFKDFTSRWHIDHRKSTRFHPQTDGLVERTNQTLKTILSSHSPNHGDNWEKYLQLAAYAINNLTHEVTRYSPFFLLKGYIPSDAHDGELFTIFPTTSSMSYLKSLRQECKIIESSHLND